MLAKITNIIKYHKIFIDLLDRIKILASKKYACILTY